MHYEVQDLIAVSMGGAGVVVFDRESGELVKQLSIGGVHKYDFHQFRFFVGQICPLKW